MPIFDKYTSIWKLLLLKVNIVLQTVQNLIRGLQQEPSDLGLHCLQMKHVTSKPYPDSEVSGLTDSG